MDRFLDFELVREFPEGNHGRVFMAVPPPRLGLDVDHVAVKVLARATSDEGFRQMAVELRVFASVWSPYLVSIHEAGEHAGRLYYAMQYFPHGSLGIRRRDVARDEIRRAVAHAAVAADALHEAAVVHADIKPTNILLDDDGAKLADLGLAHDAITSPAPGSRPPVGTIEYMDPGVRTGEAPEPASDVWALGITLHRSLTGAGVYGAIPDSDVLSALRHVASVPPQLSPDLTRREAELVRACLATDRADRPRAAEVARALDTM